MFLLETWVFPCDALHKSRAHPSSGVELLELSLLHELRIIGIKQRSLGPAIYGRYTPFCPPVRFLVVYFLES